MSCLCLVFPFSSFTPPVAIYTPTDAAPDAWLFCQDTSAWSDTLFLSHPPFPLPTAISAPTGHDQNKRFGAIYCLVLLNSLPTNLTWPNPGYTGPALAQSKAGQILTSGIQQRKDVHMARTNSKVKTTLIAKQVSPQTH